MSVAKSAVEYVAYRAVNRLNGHDYIGITGRGLQRRIKWHAAYARGPKSNAPFQRAIRKYGLETFDFEILGAASTRELAISMEIRLIATHAPHYNVSLGGDGNLGHVMCAESRARIGDSKRGNTYRLGTTHTPEVKALLRQAGLRDREKWAQRSHLGPKASARPVLCEDDGLVYSSASAAAAFYSVCKSSVIEICLRRPWRKSVGGKRFSYIAKEEQDSAPR